jgi:hypothetical protein
VAPVRAEVSEERVASIITVTRIGEIHTLMMEAIRSFETYVLTGATRHNITEDCVLHSHCRENLKPYLALTGWTV